MLYQLDEPTTGTLYGIKISEMEDGALYNVAKLAGSRANPPRQPVPSSCGTPRGVQTAAAEGGLAPGDEAYCVRAALLNLPAILSDPALVETANSLPAWSTFKNMAATLRGKHTPGFPRVLTSILPPCHVDSLDPGQQYLIRPCLPSGEPAPHCIAAHAGEMLDGDHRAPASISGLASIGHGPYFHSGRAVATSGKKRKLAK